MRVERFKTFIREQEQIVIGEELVQKGFAIGQQARFSSAKATLNSQVARARSDLDAAARIAELSDKVDALAKGLQSLAAAIGLQGELLQHIINVAVADVVLSDDVGNAVKKALSQRR